MQEKVDECSFRQKHDFIDFGIAKLRKLSDDRNCNFDYISFLLTKHAIRFLSGL